MEVNEQIKQLGREVKINRRIKGISRDKLADMSGVAELTIAKFEQGKTTPRLDTICKILSALGYRISMELN